jgi:N-acetyl-gamma-glutamyl-phosphate reductase
VTRPAPGGGREEIRAAILGGTGYGGMELLRYLAGHPNVRVTAITSRTQTGPLAGVHGHLRGLVDLDFTLDTPETTARLARENDVLFLAKPHGVAAKEAPEALDASGDVRVVDLSGDFRLETASLYEEHYGFAHPNPARLAAAAYGLPEIGQRERIRGARLVANPGCHAAATLLAVWPLATRGMIDGRVGIASVTGSSGSGAEPKKGTHHPERFGNFKAYKPLMHQHLPEIVRMLGGNVHLDFVPHSAPFARGIHVTAFVPVGKASAADVAKAFDEAYGDEPFVRLLREPPEVRFVAGTNFADVNVAHAPGVACVTVAIDNLGKGMAGTAVQNMNLLFGLEERAGLALPGLGL